MTPEDFERGPELLHQEIESPESMMPAEQVTLRHLLGVITNKTANGIDLQESTGVDLKITVPGMAVDVERYKDNLPDYNPELLASIHISEKIGSGGDQLNTNYVILETPDGIHIDKNRNTYNPSKAMLKDGMNVSPRQLALMAFELYTDIEKQEAATKTEDELGLNFVSELEAREILKLIDGLEPWTD